MVGSVEGEGLLALIGVTHDDGPEQVATIARKICELRILEGERSVLDAGAQVLVVSQFTLYGDARKGRRPSWSGAAPGPVAEPLVEQVVRGDPRSRHHRGDRALRCADAGGTHQRRTVHHPARGLTGIVHVPRPH